MLRSRRYFVIVLLTTFCLALRGILPAQAARSACDHNHAVPQQVSMVGSNCMTHEKIPVHHTTHEHGCSGCLPSPSCLSGFAAPSISGLATPFASVRTGFEITRSFALDGCRSPPDPRPPRNYLTL
ncbi:hypothetical protein [Asaia prunellae]|uniref:hypothetical protein n=1 Tax=Asaia prunellae TaxID=610245 RepID=UPI00046EBB60|nr:hypothetical protein [Asaia prunellae]